VNKRSSVGEINFETTELLSAVDAVDCLRDDLNDGEGCRPPELRTNLLKLHELAGNMTACSTPYCIMGPERVTGLLNVGRCSPSLVAIIAVCLRN
jgi:hypothetical protein